MRTTDSRPPNQRLADVLLPDGLDIFVATRRDRTRPRSWRLIARDLLDATNGQVDVSDETLRSWYGEPAPALANTG